MILRSLLNCNKGAAAAEMALVTPLLMIIVFGAFEAGNFFWKQQIVGKAVREGARYAARRPLTDFTGCVPSTSVISDTRNVTRTGRVSGGTARISNWTAATSVTVSMPTGCNTAYSGGIYVNNPGGAPTVTVSATVPYNSLFGSLGFATANLNMRADAQAAVMGF
jgi:Flp pilus assembly protein TadG